MDINAIFQQRYGFVPPEFESGALVKSLTDQSLAGQPGAAAARMDFSGLEEASGQLKSKLKKTPTGDPKTTDIDASGGTMTTNTSGVV